MPCIIHNGNGHSNAQCMIRAETAKQRNVNRHSDDLQQLGNRLCDKSKLNADIQFLYAEEQDEVDFAINLKSRRPRSFADTARAVF